MRLKSMPVLPYWFEIQTYGRPAGEESDAAADLLGAVAAESQLKPARGANWTWLGTTSVA